MEHKIFLVIKQSSCPDMETGGGTTDIEIGFTIASSKEEAMDRYPSQRFGEKVSVLGPDQFFGFTIPESW